MNLLDDIVRNKRKEVAAMKARTSLSSLREKEQYGRVCRSLRDSLESTAGFGIIAEMKRSSPSAGPVLRDIDPRTLALEYQENGARGVSVLTDECFFRGTVGDLSEARKSVEIPLLRKDFIIDEFQVFEARAYGADAILLIARILGRTQLAELHVAARETGLEALVELYDESEIDILDIDRMNLVGINNRDLNTLDVDLQRSISIARHLPPGLTIVSESGIRTSRDLIRLHRSGVRSALIGEHFLKSGRPGEALHTLLEEFDRETSG